MRKTCILIICCIFVLFNYLYAEAQISDSPAPFMNQAILPDMSGLYHLTQTEGSFRTLFTPVENERELPSVLPGFPISYSNANTYNGAVYCNMDEDPELEILFGVGKKIVAFNYDGTLVSGWPVSLTFYIWGSPAVGDIDGDGIEEIVCTSRNNTNGNTGALYAFHKDGSVVTGFPVTQTGGGTMNVCLADLNNDGIFEILVNIRNNPNGWVYAYNGSGQVVEGWPQQLNTFPGAGISAGDLDNDGDIEVIALSYNSLHVYHSDGTILTGFPVSFEGFTISYSSPVLFDLDNDGIKEIIFGACGATNGAVYVVKNDGTILNGWPQSTSSWVFATVSLGDINADGLIDVLVGDQTSSAEPANFLYAWDKNGVPLTGFPAGPFNAIYGQSAIADIDGDQQVEIVFTSNLFGEGFNAINHDGTPLNGWPLSVGTDATAVTMMSSAVIADFNGDGLLNIAGASTGFSTWLVEMYLWDTDINYNENLNYTSVNGCNIRHDGVFEYEVIEPVFNPPNNLNYTLDENDLTLNWDLPDPSATTLTGFNIYRNDILLTQNPLDPATLSFSDLDLDNGQYTYQVTAVYNEDESEPVSIIVNIAVSTDNPTLSTNQLYKNYPNPFNPSTSISYSLIERTQVSVEVFNIKGQKVRTLVNEVMNAGDHSVVWNGKDDQHNDAGSGVYFYRMTTQNYTSTGKMILIK